MVTVLIYGNIIWKFTLPKLLHTVKLQWLKHLWDYKSMFKTGLVRASEC